MKKETGIKVAKKEVKLPVQKKALSEALSKMKK